MMLLAKADTYNRFRRVNGVADVPQASLIVVAVARAILVVVVVVAARVVVILAALVVLVTVRSARPTRAPAGSATQPDHNRITTAVQTVRSVHGNANKLK